MYCNTKHLFNLCEFMMVCVYYTPTICILVCVVQQWFSKKVR